MVDFVEPIEQANWLCENHWILSGICSADFQMLFWKFLLKANQQFVEILPTAFIFQSHSICNISGKVVRSIATVHRQPILISLSIQIKVEE